MPRRPDSKARHSSAWWTAPFELSFVQRELILESVGIDGYVSGETAAALIRALKDDLGQYPGMSEALDGAPRPCHVAQRALEIQELADKLAGTIEDLDTTTSRAFRKAGVDQEHLVEVKKALSQLADAAMVAHRVNAAKESRGQPGKEAVRGVVALLCITFARFRANMDLEDRDPHKARLEFVAESLKAAGITITKLGTIVGSYPLDWTGS
jgi:hypothetical protein